MSALADRLETDLKKAMLAQDQFLVGVLRMVKSELKNQQIALGAELDDKQVEQVIRKEVKKRRESAEVYTKGGSAERAENETKEAHILAAYLPAAPELTEVVAKAAELQAANAFTPQQRGLLIRAIVEAFPGTVDGSLAAQAAAEVMQS